MTSSAPMSESRGPLTDEHPPLIGRALGPYVVIDKLGEGGMESCTVPATSGWSVSSP